jgi:hypothetical protein
VELNRRVTAELFTPPEQLCRMIEVKPDAEKDGWRKALELVLVAIVFRSWSRK